MKEISKNLQVSNELYNFIAAICAERGGDADKVLNNLADIVREFGGRNEKLLQVRADFQNKIDGFFAENKDVSSAGLVKKLTEIGYISNKNSGGKVAAENIDAEIYPMAGPQLVVPADKANMVLNAANARWASLYNSLYASNIIDEKITDVEERKATVVRYANEFLDKIFELTKHNNSRLAAGSEGSFNQPEKPRLAAGSEGNFNTPPRGQAFCWSDIESFAIENNQLVALAKTGQKLCLKDQEKFVGYSLKDNKPKTLILENNSLKVEVILDEVKVKDLLLESAITYIIDLEDASISAPENKYEGYRILKGISEGDLECEVRGEIRKINKDTAYIDAKTGAEKTLKRSSLALVRDVGAHMIADSDIITVDGNPVHEKILDMFITSFIGLRYHVAPKMHGAEEVAFTVDLWNRINELQGLPKNANKIGIMNEELRMNSQLQDAVLAAKDIVFFTNTGFLDYTGSFIDLMMHQGAIAPYRKLPAQTYKTSYELHNVNVSLTLGVPQIGAGMWAAIKDMKGLMKSKEAQVKGLTDTGWSPSPMAAAIHAIAFHIFGDVREMQNDYRKNIKQVNVADMFEFPRADLANLGEKEILENIDFAIHGLLAYAEPWVRRGIGCSGVKELSGEPLMEDRATARIKAAFVRNWLLHKVVSRTQVEDSIKRMAELVDEQNSDAENYKPVYTAALDSGKWGESEQTVQAVYELVFNPLGFKHSYVEPYFYAANRREIKA